MGLSQLLAVSRSVRTIKDGPARYKMTQQNLLPRFGGEPVVEPVVEVKVDRELVSARDGSNGSNGVDESDVSAWKAARSARPTRAAAFVEASKKLRPFGGGTIFRNPFRRLLARKSKDAPMQTELLLDSVKPIRNDLSELMVERRPEARLAPVALVPALAPEAAVAAVPVVPVAPRVGVWGRLKRRWVAAVFRTEKI